MPHLSSCVWLALSALLNMFSIGKSAIPVAAWLAPMFLLHYARSQGLMPGMVWLCVAGWLILLVWSLLSAVSHA